MTKHTTEMLSLDSEQYLANVLTLISYLPEHFLNHKIFHGVIFECTDPALHMIIVTVPWLT